MNAKYFTLAQARATLPKVKRYMEEIQTARIEILRLRPEALPAIEKAAQNGGCKEAGELFIYGARIEQGVKGITGLGVLIKDLNMGLVDFLGTRNGHDVFLCWHHGEEDIAYWHEINSGLAGRQLLDDSVN
jgi:hypothetical protein